MSYNEQPDRARITAHEVCRAHAVCPHCTVDNWSQFLMRIDEAASGTYYETAHVPPQIVLTCTQCEEDYDVAVRVVIFPAGATFAFERESSK